jgi:hypothetical protein
MAQDPDPAPGTQKVDELNQELAKEIENRKLTQKESLMFGSQEN